MEWLVHTIFDKQVDIDLLQCDAHWRALKVGQHDELDIGRRLIVMKLVLAGSEGNEAGRVLAVSKPMPYNEYAGIVEKSHLSSSPPNLRTILRKENTVPKTSLASSSPARTVCPRPAGPVPVPGVSPERDFPMIEAGRGSQRRL